MKTAAPSPGIYYDTPERVYRDWDAVNISALVEFEHSPKRFREVWDNGSAVGSAADVGTLLHAAMLQPSRIDTDIIPPPGRDVDGAWKEYGRDTKAWEKYESANPGKVICSDAERERLREMLRRLSNHKYARGAIFDPHRKTEVSLVWSDPLTGIACKARVDVLLPDTLVDLKTTMIPKINGRWLTNYARMFHWFHRAAWYTRGASILFEREMPLWFVLAQSVPDYEIVVANADPAGMAGASRQIDGWMVRLAACRAANEWPGFAPEPFTIDAPKYLIDEAGSVIGGDEWQ